MIIELFSLGATAEALRAIISSKSAISLQRGPVDPKFQVEGVAPHQPLSFSENYDKCSFIWYKNLNTAFFRFVTISLYRDCIPCSAVKMQQSLISLHRRTQDTLTDNILYRRVPQWSRPYSIVNQCKERLLYLTATQSYSDITSFAGVCPLFMSVVGNFELWQFSPTQFYGHDYRVGTAITL